MSVWAAGAMLVFALVATVGTIVRPAARGTVRAGAWLLALSGLALVLWGAASLGAAPSVLQVPMPWPFPADVLRLEGLAAGCALVAGLLFIATGWGRAAGMAPGGAGRVLLLHLLLLSVAWFLASTGPLAMLAGWEGLSITGYFLLMADPPRVRRAAWALLGLSEFGTGLLFAALLLHVGGGDLAPSARIAVALLGLFALGAKAGLFPLQVWVPVAEPEAAGDVAGLFSGILTAVAVIGYLRVVQLVDPPLFTVGVVTTVFGLAGAGASALLGLVERDIKRVLAYGTLEALGLVFTALGAAMVLESRGAGSAALIALAGAVTLLAAHAGAKYVLFGSAGWIETQTGIRLLDRAGGGLRRLGGGGAPLVVGVATLAGLPPFGGWLGEWLLIEACLVPIRAYPGLHVAFAILAALLALVAAVGLTVYLRWIGMGLLGPARTPAAERLPALPRLGVAGQWLGAGVGAAAGIAAGWVLPWAGRATAWLAHGQPVIAPTYVDPKAYQGIVTVGAALFRGVAGSTGNVVFAAGGFDVASPWDLACFALLLGLTVALVTGRLRRRTVRRVRTWVGGEPEDGLRLIWTAEGLGQPLRLTFATFFALERARRPRGDHPLTGGLLYRSRTKLRLEHHVYRPLLAWASRASGAVRQRTQSGDLRHYVGYLLGAVLLGLLAVDLLR